MSYNDVIPKVLRFIFTGLQYKISMIVVFSTGYFFIWLIAQEARISGILYSYMWCLICLPCVHVWYLMPLAFFLVLSPQRAVFLLMITIASGFWTMNYEFKTGIWKEFIWAWVFTYIPFFILLIRDHFNYKLPWLPKYSFPSDVDIIIPVFNEKQRLGTLLESIEKSIKYFEVDFIHNKKINFKVIVADGGSTDGTLTIASNYNTNIIKTCIRAIHA